MYDITLDAVMTLCVINVLVTPHVSVCNICQFHLGFKSIVDMFLSYPISITPSYLSEDVMSDNGNNYNMT